MRDRSLHYNYPVTSSDDTIYLTASAAASAASIPKTGKVSSPVHYHSAMRRQPSKIADHHLAQQQQQYLQTSNITSVESCRDASYMSQSGSGSNKPQHRRSASLLGRLRHPASMSPTSSPTSSSECSSRDTRSERTLTHSVSSGSMRHNSSQHYNGRPPSHHQPQTEDTLTYHHEPQRPSVRVLPPQHDTSADTDAGNDRGRRSGKKRSSSQQKSDGKSAGGGGFISQLLRGPSSRSRSPSVTATRTKNSAAGLAQFVRSSPGPPRLHMSPNASAGRKSPSSFADLDSEIVMTERHFTSPHMLPPPSHHAYLPDQGLSDDYMGPPSQSGPNYTPAAYFSGSHHYHASHSSHGDQSERSPNDMRNDSQSDLTSGRNSHGSAWFDPSDRGASNDHLMSALPVYEPIDMVRAASVAAAAAAAAASGSQASGAGQGFNRATQPTLPDARLLAPMASLTDILPGLGDFNALSNRELRFAVENHMLVEQHRYLIRDLGHARSAIAALKQVVQAKEERFESYELANVELQQRVSMLESLLTPEQRQQLACMPYAFNMCSVSSELAHQSLHMQQEQTMTSDDSAETLQLAADLDENSSNSVSDRQMLPQPPAATNSSLLSSNTVAAAAEARRINRPLSGYVTGYSFNDKPVSHLPRVFSGDYSAANVQAMETSVEALANAIVAMPRDEATVEDIIASKMSKSECKAQTPAAAATVTSSSECESDTADDSSQQHQQSTKGHKSKRATGDQPKRRSRFFSALRLSAFNGSAAAPVVYSADEGQGPRTNKNRRSVSLGNAMKPGLVPEALGATGTSDAGARVHSAGRARADSHESLAASCPTLLIPGIIGCQQRPTQHTARRQASADSFGSSSAGGRYPPSLGLAGSDRASSHRVPSNVSSSDDEPQVPGSRMKRLSFTPQPRRSTSAPSSRPQSMRVSSRRSWLFQLFGSSANNSCSAAAHEPSVSESESESEAETGTGGGGGRRRRVVTQSSTEVAQLLGSLQLSGEPAHQHPGHLEDVVDVSGEDEERAARPSLSVAEIRQQTLDALNGTLPRTKPAQAKPDLRILSLPQASTAAAAALGADEQVMAESAVVGSRWRQHESTVPTIMRLNPPPVQAGPLGLGVSVTRRGSLPNTTSTTLAPMCSADSLGSPDAAVTSPGCKSSANRRSQSLAQIGANDIRPAKQSPGALDDSTAHGGGKRWAPAFWAPPPVLSPANNNTWSPRDSADSFESASIASRLSGSDDARMAAPRGSLSSSSRHRRGGSPWEMVKASESRTFSPTHSRPGTPPLPSSRGLGFFEDTTVPDSDELTMAARRSLSLRMSRNAFKQAEPLPESDDTLDANSAIESSVNEVPASVESNEISNRAPLKNNALARIAAESTAQPKRRSLLWQFNSKANAVHTPTAFNDHPLRSDCASVASDDLANTGDDSIKDTCATPPAAAVALPKRPKKWWSAVLG
ncbi:hypothetical protein GGI19_000050 [Coemansia pectinata]|uniref:Uncharacterized protein n=1 Tax=Coemansia pectinata TaxID=1052879 RepID=A0A9W8LDJ0_9FUNG|nr:hypothetical protein GGI19_000050 [Coemansia pectinata]